jgi:hypothetical protein
MKKAPNPIVAAVARGMQLNSIIHICIPPGPRSTFPVTEIERIFGKELLPELGVLLLDALTSGDVTFTETFRDAIKGADELFNRHREKTLLENFFTFRVNLPEPQPRGGEMRRLYEKHLGRSLTRDQWEHLSQAMKVQGERGRPIGRIKSARKR